MNKDQWAKNLILDPMWQEMIDEMRQTEISKIEFSAPEDVDGREQAYTRLTVIKALQAQIEGYGSQQKIEEKRLKFF